MKKTQLAKEHVEKYIKIALENKTSYSKRFLATILHAEHPDLYKDVEEARRFIRTVTGSNGSKSIKMSLKDEFALMEQSVSELEYKKFIIPNQYKRTLILSDIHSRFCDKEALYTAIEYGIKRGCDSVILNGDSMDFYNQSRFDKNPNVMQYFWSEREWGQEFLQLLQKNFGKVFFKNGNHELRRELYIHRISGTIQEVLGLDKMSDYLMFDNSTVEFIEDYNPIKLGKLNIIHGHEYQGGGGVHVAYNRLNKAFDNILSSHSHLTQTNIKKDINGSFYGSWTIGCLCNLNPRYNPMNNWNHGFAIVETEQSGDFDVWNKTIINGKVL